MTFLNSHAPNSHDDGEIAVEPEMKVVPMTGCPVNKLLLEDSR